MEAAGRSVGVEKRGRLLRGAVSAGATDVHGAHLRRSSGSIPSKYETILNVGEREKRGFGSSSFRLVDARGNDEGPGPGAFHMEGSLREGFMDLTRSKRGTGGLASREKRWFNLPSSTFNPPGPGSYSPESSQDQVG
eukprot:TRINITY_DN81721_c0_g1_i3.p1 TRINITY_DN81721_c0_g1~~TRINITY_DN81721_c0_g1_i3.p1  ORF type:complete len:137 (+),score=27.71 TRINITY_DN81721_c0_g1_i3:150-560(+)